MAAGGHAYSPAPVAAPRSGPAPQVQVQVRPMRQSRRPTNNTSALWYRVGSNPDDGAEEEDAALLGGAGDDA